MNITTNHVLTAVAAVVAVFSSGCSNQKPSRTPETRGLVRNGGYEVGAAWAHKDIGGKAFLPFDASNFPQWGTRGFEKSEALKQMPAFRDMAECPGGGINGINDIRAAKTYSKDFQLVPENELRKEPYGPDDLFAGLKLPTDRPFMLSPWICRPYYFLRDGYSADSAVYAKWKAAHQNFLGFKVLVEYGNDINWYNWFIPSCTNAG